MRGGSVWAIVPVKPFDAAKLRLAPVLDAGERVQELQRAAEMDPSDVTMPDQGGTVDLADLFGGLDNWWNWQIPWQGDLSWPSA